MKTLDRRILIGTFMVIVGVFLPWHSIRFQMYRVPGALGNQIEQMTFGTVPGYLTVPGLATLVVALVAVLLVLVPRRPENEPRVMVAVGFCVALMTALFVVAGLVPLFTTAGPVPHIGLLVPIIGCGLAVHGVRPGRRDSTPG